MCKNLLCSSRTCPRANCPGPQDAHSVHRREAEARQRVKKLSCKVQSMIESVNVLKKFLKDIQEDIRGRGEGMKMEVQDLTLQFIAFFQSEADEVSTMLLTHQRHLQRMADSRQVVVIMLMMKPMKKRVQCMRKTLTTVYELFVLRHQTLSKCWSALS